MDPSVVGLIIGVILVIITLLLIFWGGVGKGEKAVPSKAVQAAPVKETPAPTPVKTAPAPVKPDDLEIIEGIGPKIASVLKQNGISTFAQLAKTDVAVLETILKDAGLRLAKPGTWPEQARLAAEGKMDELKALQDKLVGGR